MRFVLRMCTSLISGFGQVTGGGTFMGGPGSDLNQRPPPIFGLAQVRVRVKRKPVLKVLEAVTLYGKCDHMIFDNVSPHFKFFQGCVPKKKQCATLLCGGLHQITRQQNIVDTYR